MKVLLDILSWIVLKILVLTVVQQRQPVNIMASETSHGTKFFPLCLVTLFNSSTHLPWQDMTSIADQGGSDIGLQDI